MEVEIDELTEEHRQRIFVGSSRDSFKDAAADAWEKAKRAGHPGCHRVIEHWVCGENPITEYRIVLRAGG